MNFSATLGLSTEHYGLEQAATALSQKVPIV